MPTDVENALNNALYADDACAYARLATAILSTAVTPPPPPIATFQERLEHALRDTEQQQRVSRELFVQAFALRRVRCVAWLVETTSLQLRAIDATQRLVVEACACGNEALCRVLLQHGCDVNARDERDGTTPLIAAVRRGDAACVALLLTRHDVDTRASTHDGTTALDYARSMHFDEIEHALRVACAQTRARVVVDAAVDAVYGCIHASLVHGVTR